MSVSIFFVGVPVGEADVDNCCIGELPIIPPIINPTEPLPVLTAGDGDACGVLLGPPADADCVLVFRFCVSDGECAGAPDVRVSLLPASPAARAAIAGSTEASRCFVHAFFCSGSVTTLGRSATSADSSFLGTMELTTLI